MSEAIRNAVEQLRELETLNDFPRIHAAETLGTDLLGALLDEIKILQQPWQSMNQHKQNELIDRLRERVKDNVQQAVSIIAADTRVTVTATLEQVVFKGGIEAKLKLSKANQHRLDLADNVGEQVLVIIMPAEHFTHGMDDVQGETDQPGLLDSEYDETDLDNDPLYHTAVDFVRSSSRASISAVQRKLMIGYNRAARIVERMEVDGVVTAMNSNGAREVVL